MSNFNIDLTGDKEVNKKYSLNIVKFLKTKVFDISALVERERQKNIKSRIYAKPASKSYKRTGRALGGSVIRNKSSDGLAKQVVNNTKLKGAKKNYSPMLNKNKRIKRFNTNFWTDAVNAGKKETGKVYKEFLDLFK
jgi:hypothetical protein